VLELNNINDVDDVDDVGDVLLPKVAVPTPALFPFLEFVTPQINLRFY